ncbi:cytochrome P450 [Kineosporia sp. R_H_3]|uniref:cytochrome P450 n=1 Tax=Kineosporia sp. R_H_3 TaxID=1961848 RepID=UPI0018E90B54|nr:cytochrome P450 [Kineosporia sp. R_H_3]
MPVADWVDPRLLRSDPYPIYARLRQEAPVAAVPAINKVLLTSFAGCVYAEQHPEVFSSVVEGANLNRALGGVSLIRKNDPEHATERAAVNPTLRPSQVTQVWSDRFRRNTEQALDVLAAAGDRADLNRDFARPLAAKNLMDLVGIRDVPVETFARWSADFIAGAGNVLDDAEIWARCTSSRVEAESAVDTSLAYLQRHPDESMISLFVAAGMPVESIRANILLTISGGVNEPQHMITAMVYLLSQHPERRPASLDAGAWRRVFDEAVRLYTPIAMVTRQTVRDVVLEGAAIPAGSQIGIMLASANRDPAVYDAPDDFEPDRTERRHLGFGAGTHLCAGKWVAEASVAGIGVPMLYERFPAIRPDPIGDVHWEGFAFRGITRFPARLA